MNPYATITAPRVRKLTNKGLKLEEDITSYFNYNFHINTPPKITQTQKKIGTGITMEQEEPWLLSAVIDKEGKTIEYDHLIKDDKLRDVWENGMCNELSRMSKGYKVVKGTQKIRFIKKFEVPRTGEL